MEGEEVGGEGDDIDLPNLPDQPDNPDVDQDDLPMNAGGMYVCVRACVCVCVEWAEWCVFFSI